MTCTGRGEELALTCDISGADIYVACVSSAHNVCPKGYWIAIVSTIAETSANHHLELAPGIERLGQIEEQFMVRPLHPPSPSCLFSIHWTVSLRPCHHNGTHDSNLS